MFCDLNQRALSVSLEYFDQVINAPNEFAVGIDALNLVQSEIRERYELKLVGLFYEIQDL